jgi:outer membrane receptor protein involved in Fe transport
MKHFLLVWICWPAFALAQPGKSGITGRVIDPAGIPVPYASILAYSVKDSALVDGGSTDTLGRFSIPLSKGNYYVKFRFLSYNEKILSGVAVADKVLDIGDITLEPKAGYLDAIDVVVEKPLMELKLDKRIFNIEQDISTAGLNGAEILDNIPSISVDAEGNVSLRGSQNVRILINGKPSTLVGGNNTDVLRTINGSMIESVEVITNPSARYDAEGEVGIINIILKKEMEKGVNGSFNARAGWPLGYGAGFNLNIRQKKTNFFIGYGYGYQSSPGYGKTDQRYDGPDTAYRYYQYSEHDRAGFSHNINGGVDISLAPKASLTFSTVLRFSEGDNYSHITYEDYDLNDELTQTVKRNEEEGDYGINQEYGAYFRKTFDQKDRLFTLDIKKNYSIDNELSLLTEISSDISDPSIFQRTINDETEDTWLFQTDYIHPFLEDGRFETGAKVSLRNMTNDYLLEDSVNGAWSANGLFNNFMNYTENIYAGYIMAGNKTKKFSYQGGLRAEYSDVTTDLVETGEVNKRTYLRWFPSFHLAYELKNQNFLQISYSRRISRPRNWWLTPFYTFKDSRNYESGNPNINPEFAGSYELGHLKYWKKGSILTSFYYRHTVDVMERIVLTDSSGFTWRIPVNIGDRNAFGIEFSGSYEVLKWLNLNGSFNFYRAISSGEYAGVSYAADTYAWTSKFTAKVSPAKKLALQSSFTYESGMANYQGSQRAQYFWDASVSWDLLKGNGTLSFNGRDILNSRIRRSIVESDYFYSNGEFQWKSRQLTLNFVYRLNQKKTKPDFGEGGGEGGGM